MLGIRMKSRMNVEARVLLSLPQGGIGLIRDKPFQGTQYLAMTFRSIDMERCRGFKSITVPTKFNESNPG